MMVICWTKTIGLIDNKLGSFSVSIPRSLFALLVEGESERVGIVSCVLVKISKE
jgi:hypothetical protein